MDSNINRVCEGFRVIEDILRFKYNELNLTKRLKVSRHRIRTSLYQLDKTLLHHRDVQSDIGLIVDQDLNLEEFKSIESIILGNFKRVQEGLRTLEEIAKSLNRFEENTLFKEVRYVTYNLEREIIFYIEEKPLLTLPSLYGITYLKGSRGRSNIDIVEEFIKADLKLIQYREKDLSQKEKLKECIKIRELTSKNNVTFIVNDDIDIALLVDADGVHIGQDDLPINRVRKLIGKNKIIGVSTHSPSQAKKAELDGADYIGVGPIFPTKTKVNVCKAVGLDYLKWVEKNISIPFVAIGGIKEANIDSVLSQGAKSVAIVSELTLSNDISSKVKAVIRKIEEKSYNEV
ncbi:thiamine phosphate synthase [Thiospirochaeta perfilievii]|uniref:Thiamine-phosphate synthase n=2 Tax=Thiospirochaeta perfilievii TaxID=252967 RepID=A0A5C1QHD5_9SPIO|nr:thiamine phosphate synthase [Thiospirochaeta perfilievii]